MVTISPLGDQVIKNSLLHVTPSIPKVIYGYHDRAQSTANTHRDKFLL